MTKSSLKIHFMPAWGMTSKQILASVIGQTPGSSGKWGNIEGTDDPESADFYIIQDYTDAPIDYPERTIYFSREPPGAGPISDYTHMGIRKFSWMDGTSFLYTKWIYQNPTSGGVTWTYDNLKEYSRPPAKTKGILCVQSHKTDLPGHKLRVQFIRDFYLKHKNPLSADLYGTIGRLPEFSSIVGQIPNNSKIDLLKDYKYSLSFDNGMNPNFFGTQVTDTLLSWTVPIYHGCPNLGSFFPRGSFETFDARSPDTEIPRIVELVKNDDFEARVPALIEARELILDRYNIWAEINRCVTLVAEGK